MSPGRLRHLVAESIVRHRLWSEQHDVVVAVSGGLDSVSLLDLLLQTQSMHRARSLGVVTVNHGTRPDAAADADFVEELARQWSVPCFRFDLELGANASEATLRDGRYGVFERVPADRIALAHHRGDLAETLLLHALRGTGTHGLGGMARQRGRYVRPLLDISRTQLEAWTAHRDLSFREDPTNRDPRFLRNRIRQDVMPTLESLRPGAEAALARSARHAAEDDALLEQLAVESFSRVHAPETEISTVWCAEAPEPLVRRGLLRQFPQLTSAQIDAVLAASRRGSGRVLLQGGALEVSGDRLRFIKPDLGG